VTSDGTEFTSIKSAGNFVFHFVDKLCI